MGDFLPQPRPDAGLSRHAAGVIEALPFAEPAPDPRDLWRILRKRRWLVTTFFLAVFLSVAVFTFLATPLYTAETLLLIERRPPQVINIETVLAESLNPDERAYYQTQYQILESRSLASQVIEELRLFDEELLWTPAKDEAAADGVPKLIQRYLTKWLEVEPLRNSRLVKLRFSTPAPELSARALAAHVDAYMRQGQELRTVPSEQAERFLEEQLVELQARVEQSEVALNAYSREHGIISLDQNENVTIERLTDLNRRLTEVEAERITQEANVHLIRQRDFDSLPAVIDSALISTLKESLARLEGDLASLSTQFKPAYPQLARLRAQVVETRSQLRQEIQSIVEGIESSYLAAVDAEGELRSALEAQKAAALDQKDAGVHYAILEREAETNRELYDGVLQRMKEIGVAAELRASNVFVIDPAEPPLRPSSPRKGINLALALVFGLLGGVASAFLAERLDDTMKTPKDVERELRLPNLAVVPNLQQLGRSRQPWLGERARRVLPWLPAEAGAAAGTESEPAFEPDAAVAEAYRSVRTGILLSRAGEAPRTILFTSATRGEGKTVSLLNTAIMFAQLGPPVLIVDADLRRPRCHDGLGIDNDIGLTEVLTGQIEAVKAIHPTNTPLSILPSGAKAPNPTELLGSSQMRDFLTSMQKRYAYVLIDAPPLLPVSDSVVLSTLVDGVVLVVDRSATPRRMVLEARARLTAARAKVLGVVLNRVDVEDPGYAHYRQGYYS